MTPESYDRVVRENPELKLPWWLDCAETFQERMSLMTPKELVSRRTAVILQSENGKPRDIEDRI